MKIRSLNGILKGGMLLVSIGLLAGCQNDESKNELKHYVENVKKRPSKMVEPIPTARAFPRYEYPADPKRDPFRPFLYGKLNNLVGPDIQRPKQALEAYPLDALRLVGTVYDHGKLWAIIGAPNGRVYRVRKGGYIGKNYGQIINIHHQKVAIVESVQQAGGWVKRDAALLLEQTKPKTNG